jgi:uncharacterized protein (TIGR02421 family)
MIQSNEVPEQADIVVTERQKDDAFREPPDLAPIGFGIGKPLDWSAADRCRLLILIVLFFFAAYALRTSYLLTHPDVEPYYDRATLVPMRDWMVAFCVFWALFLVWGSLERRKSGSHTLYPVVGSLSWWLGRPNRRASPGWSSPMSPEPTRPFDSELARSIGESYAEGCAVRRRLPPSGRIVLERQLPFLFVYRPPAEGSDPGTASLIGSEASFLAAPADRSAEAAVTELVRSVAATAVSRFGGFLIVELWSGAPDPAATPDAPGAPAFRILTPPEFAATSTVAGLGRALRQLVLFGQKAKVSVTSADAIAAPGLAPLLGNGRSADDGVRLLGLEVRSAFRDGSGTVYPIALRALRQQLGRALRRAAFEFSRRETTLKTASADSLGRRAFTKLVWDADRRISEISSRFDLLLLVTPTNGARAFEEFERSGFEQTPRFLYRARTIDPPLLKRALYDIPVERVTDPTLAFLFEEKRRELDLKLTLVEERLTRRFMPTGIALYGTVDDELVREAEQLLERVAPQPGSEEREELDAAAFARRAEALLEALKTRAPALAARVTLSDEVSSLTVSDGNLLIGSGMTFQEGRVEALLQHELGTHVVTHWNGSQQRMTLLSAGLAGYDELQEGLAVFAEYLVGGLTAGRLRTLAGRVLAARSVVAGASFAETWKELRERGFSERAAFTNSMRVHRGGGFVKDAVYLRGLREVLDFVARGGKLETLFIGKVATSHAPLIEELQQRKILKPIALRPLYMDDPAAQARLEHARSGITLDQLIAAPPPI